MTKPVYTVPRVPNKRKPGQQLITFYVPATEYEAFKAAYTEAGDTATEILRRAVTAYLKRAEKKRQEP